VSQYLWPNELVRARFLERRNRFVACVDINERKELAHVPNSGRMKELLVPGNEVFLLPTPGENRVTQYQLCLARYGQELVSLNSLLPNKLLERKLQENAFPWLFGTGCQREVTYKNSRFDFFVSTEGVGGCYVEAKSVTLVESDTAFFPDAPTARGKKHLEHLIDARSQGYSGAVVFVVQRCDAKSFRPNEARDPEFARTLLAAVQRGITIKAYNCRVNHQGIYWQREILVQL